MNEYTPTTEHVRDALRPYRVHPLEFDRWLAAHDREVAERAWDDGHNAGWNEGFENAHEIFVERANPYRRA